jgi:hypothetical protein
MVSVLVSKVVDRGFIGGVMATIYLFRDKNANHYATDEPTIYRFRCKHVNHYAHGLPLAR